MLLRDMGPVTVSFVRVATAALTCWAYLLIAKQSMRVSSHHIVPLAVMGALMFAVPFSIYPLGQQYVATGVAGIVNALTPVMVVVISHFWPEGERATPLKVLGVLVGFLGIVFLTIPAFQSGDSTKLFGTFVILIAPISYACAMNWVRRFKSIPTSVTTTWAFSFAALLLLPVSLAFEGTPKAFQPSTWVSILILGTVLTGTFFLIAFAILPRAGATKTSTVTFIAPVSALLIGWWVLEERLEPAHFIGMAAIFLGLFLIDGRLFRRKVN
jgi:drug/metabolite transporter (DMT)-like permease